MNTPHFLLIGNGPYVNRGCEAIVHGTVQILKRAFPEPFRVTNAAYGPARLVRRQAAQEGDLSIRHIALKAERFSLPWAMDQLNRRIGSSTPGVHWPLVDPLRSCTAALEVGGDNYSLDYGIPRKFIEMDRFILAAGRPVVIWGASVGPFDAQPAFAAEMHEHLRQLTAIFVRETGTLEYLNRHGIQENVHLVADPAFATQPEPPPSGAAPDGPLQETIGLNLSGRMAQYVTSGDVEQWLKICSEMVLAILRRTGRRVLLIPHVMNPDWWDNDFIFCDRVRGLVAAKAGDGVALLPADLSAAQLKHVISQCGAFVGARTHSTIAALSSCVPTVSLAYSIKARGINRDTLGTLDYCVEPKDMTAEGVSERVVALLAAAGSIRVHLQAKMPEIVDRAYNAGTILREILVSRGVLTSP